MKEIIVAIVGAIIGGLLAGLCGVYLARYTSKINRRNDASGHLYAAFLPTLMRLDPEEGMDIGTSDIIDSALEQHRVAAFEFRFHLSAKERIRFDKAWQVYQGDIAVDYFDTNAKSKRLENRKRAIDRIHVLLTFAGYEN